MSRLDEVIVFTPQLDLMRHFYERGMGLKVREEIADWVQYDTPGVHLALHAQWDGHDQELALVFESSDFDDKLAALRARGLEVDVRHDDRWSGRLALFRDPEGNLVEMHPPGAPVAIPGGSLELPRVLINCRDLGSTTAFYRDALGLAIVSQTPESVVLDARPARLALQIMAVAADQPLHAGQPLVFGFETRDLAGWADVLRARGLQFATAPTDEDFGSYAEATDPDGNVVLFHQPALERTIEEELAEDFEDDAAPVRTSMHKPVKKGTKAVSRVVIKPGYRKKTAQPRRRPSATTQSVVKVRGGGPDRTRKTPKRTGDEKKARGKLAIGRAKKATRSVMARKKRAVAKASKRRPVKRAASRTTKKK